MAIFITLAKIYSTEYFCNAKVAGLSEIFVQQKFLTIQYYHYAFPLFRHCVRDAISSCVEGLYAIALQAETDLLAGF